MATFLEIHSPQPPTQCIPTTFSWDGGIAPYTLKITAVTPDFQVGDVLQTFTGIGNQSLQWPVNLVGGTLFGIVLSDSTPITVQFEPVTVQAGPDSSCLGGTSTSRGGSGTTSSAITTTTAVSTSSSFDPNSVGTPTAVASGSSTDSVAAISSGSSTSSSAGPTDLAGAVTTNTSKPLGAGVVAGIAICATLAGILIAVLVYWMWRKYGRRRVGSPRTLGTFLTDY
ncbi:hypothetical protein L227DRAFT_88806 [Lentinus tigrinus ALCF2SS1-6]|uniref:Mid2 domain-containing protein n=1 Tax=Lentinus tigrinus ALCF2SS1-6 TaxID=1328759 RepID=A0A5C2S9N3_9APHY|nr:hypothetical protein L227DRAFT_88806 [Lentinus tigrinus ALCF2SS1-6]